MTSICSWILTCARCSHMRLPHRKMQCISSLYNMRTHLCLFQQLLAHRVHVSRMQLLLSLLPEISDVLPSCITTARGRIIIGETTSHQFSFDAMVCLAILSVDERCECVASVADAEAVGVATMGAEAACSKTADAAAADAAALELSLLCGTTFLDFLVIALRRVAAFRFFIAAFFKAAAFVFCQHLLLLLFSRILPIYWPLFSL